MYCWITGNDNRGNKRNHKSLRKINWNHELKPFRGKKEEQKFHLTFSFWHLLCSAFWPFIAPIIELLIHVWNNIDIFFCGAVSEVWKSHLKSISLMSMFGISTTSKQDCDEDGCYFCPVSIFLLSFCQPKKQSVKKKHQFDS